MTRPEKRVLECIPTLEGGGTERQLSYLARGLTDRGWHVSIALLRGGQNVALLSDADIPLHQLKYLGHYDPRLVREIAQLIRAERPSVVHTWLPLMDIVGGTAAHRSGIPWVCSERNSDTGARPLLRDRIRRAVVSRWADAVVANSESGAHYTRSQVTMDVPLFVVPNGIPIDHMDSIAPVSKTAMGVGEDRRVILYAARFHPSKRLDLLIDALPEVFRRLPDAVAVICGDGPLRDHFRRRIWVEGLADRVVIAGYVEPLVAWMKAADVFVSTSSVEGHPNRVLEAMTAGCPLVLSDIPPHREMVSDEAAVFFSLDSLDQLVDGLTETLAEPRLAAARARCARMHAEMFPLDPMFDAYERIYEKVARPR